MHATDVRPATKMIELLIVDDDPATEAAVRGAVPENTHVRRVANGYEAWDALATELVDMVVLELFLPGLSGMQLLQRLQAHGRRVRTAVLTIAHGASEELAALGVDVVLRKPVSVDALRSALHDLLVRG